MRSNQEGKGKGNDIRTQLQSNNQALEKLDLLSAILFNQEYSEQIGQTLQKLLEQYESYRGKASTVEYKIALLLANWAREAAQSRHYKKAEELLVYLQTLYAAQPSIVNNKDGWEALYYCYQANANIYHYYLEQNTQADIVRTRALGEAYIKYAEAFVINHPNALIAQYVLYDGTITFCQMRSQKHDAIIKALELVGRMSQQIFELTATQKPITKEAVSRSNKSTISLVLERNTHDFLLTALKEKKVSLIEKIARHTIKDFCKQNASKMYEEYAKMLQGAEESYDDDSLQFLKIAGAEGLKCLKILGYFALPQAELKAQKPAIETLIAQLDAKALEYFYVAPGMFQAEFFLLCNEIEQYDKQIASLQASALISDIKDNLELYVARNNLMLRRLNQVKVRKEAVNASNVQNYVQQSILARNSGWDVIKQQLDSFNSEMQKVSLIATVIEQKINCHELDILSNVIEYAEQLNIADHNARQFLWGQIVLAHSTLIPKDNPINSEHYNKIEWYIERLGTFSEYSGNLLVAKSAIALINGDIKVATTCLEKYLSTNPAEAKYQYELGVLLLDLGHEQEAVLRFHNAAYLDPIYETKARNKISGFIYNEQLVSSPVKTHDKMYKDSNQHIISTAPEFAPQIKLMLEKGEAADKQYPAANAATKKTRGQKKHNKKQKTKQGQQPAAPTTTAITPASTISTNYTTGAQTEPVTNVASSTIVTTAPINQPAILSSSSPTSAESLTQVKPIAALKTQQQDAHIKISRPTTTTPPPNKGYASTSYTNNTKAPIVTSAFPPSISTTSDSPQTVMATNTALSTNAPQDALRKLQRKGARMLGNLAQTTNPTQALSTQPQSFMWHLNTSTTISSNDPDVYQISTRVCTNAYYARIDPNTKMPPEARGIFEGELQKHPRMRVGHKDGCEITAWSKNYREVRLVTHAATFGNARMEATVYRDSTGKKWLFNFDQYTPNAHPRQ